MLDGFKGSYTTSLDSKGRVAVPVKLRRNPEAGETDRFVITRGLNGCLFLFPPDYWDEILGKLAGHSFTRQKTLYFTRMLMSNAEELKLDDQARIRIPSRLIQQIGLQKEVLFVGNLRLIEVWKPETFSEYQKLFEIQNHTSYENVAEDLLL